MLRHRLFNFEAFERRKQIGPLFNAATLMELTGSVGVGTSAYLTANSLIWIEGMILFGLGALVAHNDFDGEWPLLPVVDDVRLTEWSDDQATKVR